LIVKVVDSKKGGSFGGLADYLLDKLQLHKDKVESYSFSNCLDDELLDADLNISIIKNLQAISTSKADKTMHLVVSFQEDERPTKEQLKEIEKELLKSIGMEHHQRLSVVHDNTNNYHLHIAVNRIDPETYKRADPPQDFPKLHKKAAELEEKFNLKRDNHTPNKDLAAKRKTKETTYTKEELNEQSRQNRPNYNDINRGRATAIQRRAATLHESNSNTDGREATPQSLSSVRELSSVNMVQNSQSVAMLLQGDAHDLMESIGATDNAVRREGESVDAAHSRDGGERVKESQKQKDIKAHSGVSNLAIWIKENVLDDIKKVLSKSTNYKDLHETLAKWNLEIKERGNGLIIKDKHRNLFVKASEIHRSFSKANLEKQFGKFEAMDIDIKPTAQFGVPKHDFWEKYQAQQEQLKQTKSKELGKIKESYFKDKEALSTIWKDRMNFLKQSTNIAKRDKKGLYQTIFQKKKEQLDELYNKYTLDKEKVYQKFKTKTYKEYLIEQALTGDTTALEVLRKQKPPKQKEGENTIGDKIDHKLLISRNPTVTKAGYVIYKPDPTKDSQKIIDKGNHLKITGADDAALLEALKLGCVKYGQKLNIAGDTEFKMKVIDLVNEHKLDIEFKDKKMQDVLESLKSPKQEQKMKPNEKSSDFSL